MLTGNYRFNSFVGKWREACECKVADFNTEIYCTVHRITFFSVIVAGCIAERVKLKNKIPNFLLLLLPNLKFSKQPRERSKKVDGSYARKTRVCSSLELYQRQTSPLVDITLVGAVFKTNAYHESM